MERSFSLKGIFVFIGLLFLLIFLVGIFFAANSSNKKIGSLSSNAVNLKDEEQNIQDSDEIKYSSGNSADEEISSDESNVINEGGGSGKSVSLNPECKTVSVSYALKHFNENSVCNEYSGENCIDKTITCSMEVQNLDSAATVEFKSVFRFYNSQSELVNSATDSKMINSGDTEYFEKNYQLTGEVANNELDCRFDLEEPPQKEVCS